MLSFLQLVALDITKNIKTFISIFTGMTVDGAIINVLEGLFIQIFHQNSVPNN